MKLLIFLLLVTTTNIALSQSQMELNQTEKDNYLRSEKEINAVYKALMVKYVMDTTFCNRLKAAQRLWIKFRDAHIEAFYPKSIEYSRLYGSMQPICYWSMKEKLTIERIIQLKQFFSDKIDDDDFDICGPTVITKNELEN